MLIDAEKYALNAHKTNKQPNWKSIPINHKYIQFSMAGGRKDVFWLFYFYFLFLFLHRPHEFCFLYLSMYLYSREFSVPKKKTMKLDENAY